MKEISPRLGLGEKFRKIIAQNTPEIVFIAGTLIAAVSIDIGIGKITTTNNAIAGEFTRSLEEIGLSREDYFRAKSMVLIDINNQTNQVRGNFAAIEAIKDEPQNKKAIEDYINGRALEQGAGDKFFKRRIDDWGLLIGGTTIGFITFAEGIALLAERKRELNN